MYKILIADDEGIVIEALKFIIEKNFDGQCEIQSAKTGRSVIELAETFRPDIALMDIQMPGINGIEAMKEIRKTNSNIIFIIISAFNKFDYAKEAINIDVLEYINKPIQHDKIVATLKTAMKKIDQERTRRSDDLKIKEKLEIVVPFIESGFIYSILFTQNTVADTDNYRQLLSVDENSGFIMVIECGDTTGEGKLDNAIGSGVKIQNYYPSLRGIVKEYFPRAIVGSAMANKVICFVPAKHVAASEEYDKRIALIDSTREMVRVLKASCELSFRVGIGDIATIENAADSYQEANKALAFASGSVAHAKDLPVQLSFDAEYPIENEHRLYELTTEGDEVRAVEEAKRFFSFLVASYPGLDMDIRLKVLEVVLWCEKLAYESGGMTYHFASRHDYLNSINAMDSYAEMESWFIGKISEAVGNIKAKKIESTLSTVEKAKEYILDNYSKDISLDDVSKQVNISPYYFSKMFKAELGINFIDYLTDIRMNQAKKLLAAGELSMKEICSAVGYSDPNYFSRTFKKNVGVTPTEYREKV